MPVCTDCHRNQVAKTNDICIDCKSRNLQIQLNGRSTEQKRQEFLNPAGHTLPSVTVPMMGNQMVQQSIPTYQQPQTQVTAPSLTVSSTNPRESKILELQAKIDAIKKGLNGV